MKAIVYTSNSGFTKKYASLLSIRIALPVYDLKEAKAQLKKGDEIIYMSWICAGAAAGYNKAVKNFTVRALCAVGMGIPTDEVAVQIKERHNIGEGVRVFCLQGGFDINKLHGIYKLMMKAMTKSIASGIEAKAEKTAADADMLEMIKNGGDRVNEKSLEPVVGWYEQFRSL